MEFPDLVYRRQSVRKFSSRPVEQDKLHQCVEALRLSPSACNAQPWTAIIVDQPGIRDKVAGYVADALMNKFVKQAPVLVVVVMEPTNFTSWLGGTIKRRKYPLMDIGIAAEHFCLQATELGLGTCMIGWFDEKSIKKLLSVPRIKRVGLVIAAGYPPENYPIRNKSRKSFEEICRWNSYR